VPLALGGCGRAGPTAGDVASSTRLESPTPTSQSSTSILASCAMFSAPGPRTAASITYQPLARQFLLFGGDILVNGGIQSVAETWLWDGKNWTTRGGPGPSARAYAAMDYDVAHDQVVLYGGQYNVAGQSPVHLFDLWLWDGVRWIANSAPSPKLIAPRGVYDVSRANFVLFGIGGNGPETWLWNGLSWSAASPAHSPSTRSGEGMAYVAKTKHVVLFGGSASGIGRLNDTWRWDGSDWQNAQPTLAPPPRALPAFISGQQALLFGGAGGSGGLALADTWRWDGTQWTQLNGTHVPTARRAAAGASDGTYLVIVGGDSAGMVPGVWRWDGTNWNQC
jgi:hypothetical protein